MRATAGPGLRPSPPRSPDQGPVIDGTVATDAPQGRPQPRPGGALPRLAHALPDWVGSIRFRLTALYSLLLFALAGATVAGLYAVLARRLNQESLYVAYNEVHPVPGGFEVTRGQMLDQYRLLEHLANERSLALLRSYSLSALGGLFLASLVIGWVVAGRVLAPIGHITEVAREIQATDLSRRIDLAGPPDELAELADTFDAMLTRLDEAFESQQRFIQEASHELRNPLAIIRTNLDVALADPDPDPAELRRVAELVNGTASRMSHLVDDLLVYARQGSPAHEIGPVDLAELLHDAAAELSAPAAARSLRLDVSAPPDVVTHGDRLALRQALTNLATNAVRLAPSGSTIRLTAGRSPEGTWMAVSDEGPGIAPEHRALVFERFWRGDRHEGRRDGRSGLGLAIVDQIVRDHAGSVALEPSPAAGSTFTIRLPASPPASALRGLSPAPLTVSDERSEL